MLARHAKAQGQGSSDEARELSARGHADAAAMGGWLRAAGLSFDTVICSTSVRTRQTWNDVEAAGVAGGDAAFDERVYGAGRDDLLDVLREVPDTVTRLLVVGHAPTIPELAGALTDPDSSDPAALAALRSNFPTACLAVLTMDQSWAELSPGCAALVEVVTPRAELSD